MYRFFFLDFIMCAHCRISLKSFTCQDVSFITMPKDCYTQLFLYLIICKYCHPEEDKLAEILAVVRSLSING